MRILGFSKKWQKLSNLEFTTFRFTRRGRDWEVGELVQVVFTPRSKGGGERLGMAEIIDKQPRNVAPDWGSPDTAMVSNDEAIADGFMNWGDMFDWLCKTHDMHRLATEPMNKLTLRKIGDW